MISFFVKLIILVLLTIFYTHTGVVYCDELKLVDTGVRFSSKAKPFSGLVSYKVNDALFLYSNATLDSNVFKEKIFNIYTEFFCFSNFFVGDLTLIDSFPKFPFNAHPYIGFLNNSSFIGNMITHSTFYGEGFVCDFYPDLINNGIHNTSRISKHLYFYDNAVSSVKWRMDNKLLYNSFVNYTN